MLCALLQRNQNPSGAEQGCPALSRRSNHTQSLADFITNTSGFSFRYTQSSDILHPCPTSGFVSTAAMSGLVTPFCFSILIQSQ